MTLCTIVSSKMYNCPPKRQRTNSDSSGTLSVQDADAEDYQSELKVVEEDILTTPDKKNTSVADIDHDYSLPYPNDTSQSKLEQHQKTLSIVFPNSLSHELGSTSRVSQNETGLCMTPKIEQFVVPMCNEPGKVFYLPIMDSMSMVTDLSGSQSIQSTSKIRDVNSPWQQYVKQFKKMGPCPICGDKISGYHYGIFCCESCKGFFKRTVQGNKTYVCHRGPNQETNCEVTLSTRRKCPACRYQKCQQVGMRADAIRADRTRGGRSVYPGSKMRDTLPQTLSTQPIRLPAVGHLNCSPDTHTQSSDLDAKEVNLQTLLSVCDPVVHPLVKEALEVEETVANEEDTLELGEASDELAVYKALLLLADQRLYRLVRWSRQLPAFCAASTEDQILLLQNCWADLLCLDCCWRSLATPQEIRLTANKCINLEAARELGAHEIVNKILILTQELHRLKLDQTEYACFKVILLMQPDVSNLRGHATISKYLDELSGGVMQYSMSAYPHVPNKSAELFLKLPDLRRISNLAREILLDKDLTSFLSPQSLLMELLAKSATTTNRRSNDSCVSSASHLYS